MQSRFAFAFLLVLAPGHALATESDDPRPFSSGAYEIRVGGERIGEEQFQLYKKKGYLVESTKTLYWPEPTRYEYHYELEPSRDPKKLMVTTTRGGNFTELKLERKRDNWRLEVKGRGRKKKKHELGRREGTVVDFGSVLFTSLVLRKLNLNVDEQREVDAIVMTLPDIAGARVEQTYRRVEDEDIETEVRGKVRAAVYELENEGRTHRIWVDPTGIVLHATLDRIDGEREIVLVRWNNPGPSWP